MRPLTLLEVKVPQGHNPISLPTLLSKEHWEQELATKFNESLKSSGRIFYAGIGQVRKRTRHFPL